jgi:hypothetical protein
MRNDRHDRHASGECEGQRENQGYLFHGRDPSPVMVRLPGSAKAIRDGDHDLEDLGATRPLRICTLRTTRYLVFERSSAIALGSRADTR